MTLQFPPAGTNQTQLIEGPAGAIEALLASPRQPAWGSCLICHPHPLYGGAMSNKVVYSLASAAGQAGLHTLRFNFRGVGRSAGRHDEGRGEADDAIWLAEQMRAALPADMPLVLAGFSFGAFVVLKAAARVQPAALMQVAPPFAATRDIYVLDDGALPQPRCPWRVIHSRDDDTVSYDETVAALTAYKPGPQLITVDGAGHFFHGRLSEVAEAFNGLLTEIAPPA